MLATWFTLTCHRGVLEFPRGWTSPAPALELHLAFTDDGSTALAWWETEDGVCLGRVLVGRA